jgi:hypothetical protein
MLSSNNYVILKVLDYKWQTLVCNQMSSAFVLKILLHARESSFTYTEVLLTLTCTWKHLNILTRLRNQFYICWSTANYTLHAKPITLYYCRYGYQSFCDDTCRYRYQSPRMTLAAMGTTILTRTNPKCILQGQLTTGEHLQTATCISQGTDCGISNYKMHTIQGQFTNCGIATY